MDKFKTGNTLKHQFIIKIFLVFIIITLVLGSIQYYYLSKQINNDVNNEAKQIETSIEQGIKETDLASRSIEQQIDVRLKIIAERISERLENKKVEEITNEELKRISSEFEISGITIFTKESDDIVGAKSTEPNDIGFSFKKELGAEDSGFIGLSHLLDNKMPVQNGESYVDENTIILLTSQSGSHKNKPTFFKYAYYHKKGQDFVINPFIEANEVYQFTQSVGPDTWIQNVVNTNKVAKEVAVLEPRVYADPSLAEKMYPPLKKVVYGEFALANKKDKAILKGMAKDPKRTSYISGEGEDKLYKVFIPRENGQVIYVALDYSVISKPLHKLAILLIAFSAVSLLALFILTARFFSSLYKQIQEIIKQIKQLESGDFTAKSNVKAKGELASLSASTNHMTAILNKVLKDTTKQAEKVQHLSQELKSETDSSVDTVYALSLDLTANAREDNFEITDFLNRLEQALKKAPKNEEMLNVLESIEKIRDISNTRSESTTQITLILADLLKSLQLQSDELLNISSELFHDMYKFKL
ncbi:methyl-accepting chemotaxis protein [Bacillus massiliglaciei]|uniref:methyl-accepting chemotaxis protein n=1 Tax=Bacillus massiliglaciei TaxID=1816693 RepID=UPI000DA5FE56|nr:methyl-accepting chemotaxis protein [Bacillus massiliglaciei]